MNGISLCSRITFLVFVLIFCETNGGSIMSQQRSLQTDYANNSESTLLDILAYSEAYHNPELWNTNCSRILKNEFVHLGNGSIFIPEMGSVYSNTSYFVDNETAYLCLDNMIMETTTDFGYDLSDEFLNCGHVLIEPGKYQLLQNGSVYVEMYSKIYGSRDYFLLDEGLYICFPNIEEILANLRGNSSIRIDKFSSGLAYVTYVGLTLSIISLLSHLIVFCIVSSVRNLPGYCLASLSLSLLMAYLSFLPLALAVETEHCASLGMSVYYFFLTSFFWMNAIAFDVWRSFRVVVRKLRISSHRVPWRRFLLYSIYSWGTPALLTTLVKYGDETDLLPKDYRPAFAAPNCWFGQRKALLVFFAIPLGIVMLLNALFFMDVTYVISRATLKTSQSHRATLKKRFFMFMRLALIMGLTWIVGLIAGYADTEALWYLFLILNTLQGVFIFVVFSCSSKLRGLCCKSYGKHSKYSGNSSVRTISQISAI